jgi:hypothetical protein
LRIFSATSTSSIAPSSSSSPTRDLRTCLKSYYYIYCCIYCYGALKLTLANWGFAHELGLCAGVLQSGSTLHRQLYLLLQTHCYIYY